MEHRIELRRNGVADEGLRAGLYRLIHDVVRIGGAVGWLAPPGRDETDAWLDGVLADVREGDAVLALATHDGEIATTGLWRRERAAVFRRNAELQKIMTHPAARGHGLGRRVVAALVEDARAAGVEVLRLGVRGNNHGAIALYQDLGFHEIGRVPDAIALGSDRHDEVLMYIVLGRPADAVLHGSAPSGLGASPAQRTGSQASR